MSIFSKKTWKDFIAEYPNRRKIKNVDTQEEQIVEVQLDVGTIQENGDKWQMSSMNDLEDRIDSAFEDIEDSVSVYVEEASEYADDAAASSVNALNRKRDAEAWAIGTREGIPVESTDLQYENNAKYYSDQARSDASDASTSKSEAASYSNQASNYASNAETAKLNAQSSATSAQQSYIAAGNKALEAEGIANGTQNGVPVTSQSPYYHNNAKYWKECAEAVGSSTFSGLMDVNIQSPQNGQAPIYNSTTGKWENGDAASKVSELKDTYITNPSDGQALKYNASTQKWENGDASVVAELGDLTDVNLTDVQNKDVLQYDSITEKWINAELSDEIAISATEPTGDEVLWINPEDARESISPKLSTLEDVDIEDVENEQVLRYNANTEKWENVDMPSPVGKMNSTNPRGTGNFAMNTNNTPGDYAFIEGNGNSASGNSSHAEGLNTIASGVASHTEGVYTKATGNYQHVEGKYNIEDTQNRYAHIIGNGDSDNSRNNAYTLDWNGKGEYAGDVIANKGKSNEVSLSQINTDLTQKAIKHTTGTFTTNAYGWITFPYGQLVVMAKLKDNAYDYNHLSLEPVMQPQGSVMTKTYFQSTYNTTATAKALSANTSYDVEYWYFNIEPID